MNNQLYVLAFLFLSFQAFAQSDNCHEFSLTDEGVVLPVVIEGQEVSGVLTSGNIGVSITEPLAEELELPLRRNSNLRFVPAIGRKMPYRYVTDVDLDILGVDSTVRELAVIDSDASHVRFSLNVFRNLIIQIDFPQSRICFYPPDAIDLRDTQNLPLYIDPRYDAPVVRATLDGTVNARLALMLGYRNGVMVDPFIANELNLPSRLAASPETHARPDSETHTTILDKLQFGPYELSNVQVEFPKEQARDNLTTGSLVRTGSNIVSAAGYRGRVGLDVLRHFVVTLNLETERMHVYAP